MVLSVASVRRDQKQKKSGKAMVSTALMVKLVLTVMSSIHLILFVDQTLVIFPFTYDGTEYYSPIPNDGTLKCQKNDKLEVCSLCEGNKKIQFENFGLLS